MSSNYDPSLFVNQEKKVRGFQKLLEPTTRQAIMVIEAPPDMGKTWLISRMQSHCQEITINLPTAHVDFRNPRLVHEIQDFLGLLRVLRNRLNQAEYFGLLNSTINSLTTIQPGSSVFLTTLRRNMEMAFNLDELQGLAFDLRVDYENLAGDTKSARVRSMISYCERLNLLPKLLGLCQKLRPEMQWEQEMTPMTTPVAAPPTAVSDNNGILRTDTEKEMELARRQINEAFFTCLTQLSQAKGQVVFLFDSYEAAPPEAEQWVRLELLPRLREGQCGELTVIITGRKTPDLTELNIKHLLVQTNLDPFTEDHIREYFENRRKLSGLDIRTIVLTSGGVPGALAMMADHAMATSQSDDDFFKDL